MKKKIKILPLILLVSMLFSGCENSNIFSWAHPGGNDDSTAALLTDGQKALLDRNYTKAIEYYQKILDKDPDNSEALYGLAAAELKNVGLDLSVLLPKFLNNADGISNTMAFRSPGKTVSSVDDLLPQMNYVLLEAATAVAVAKLRMIADGNADGTIPADDIDVNINLSISLIIHAASYLLNKYNISIDEDFQVEALSDISQADIDYVVGEIEDALEYLLVLVQEEINIDDIRDGFNDFKAEIESLL
ncbi:MAG: tetratricopeptide repeat protein [Elusimicrobiota bacterium]